MKGHRIRTVMLTISIIAVSGIMVSSYATLPQAYITATDKAIDTVRKGNFSILVLTGDTKAPLANTAVKVSQKRNHFGFGAAVCWDSGFAKVGNTQYGDIVKKYFEWATPENEMKWYYTDNTNGQPCAPGTYDDADSIVDWCLANNINVRGHTLFWN
jgi:GH35 family endo-1,4-beta-xylanase